MLTRRDLFRAMAGAFAGAVAGVSAAKDYREPVLAAPSRAVGTGPQPAEFLTGQQRALLECDAPEIQLTGPRGCGKTWALARWLADSADDPDYRGLYVAQNHWSVDYFVHNIRMVRSKDFGELRVDRGTGFVFWPGGARITVKSESQVQRGALDGHEFRRAALDNYRVPEGEWARLRSGQIAFVDDRLWHGVSWADAIIHFKSPDLALVERCSDTLNSGAKIQTLQSQNPPPPGVLPLPTTLAVAQR